MSSRYWRKVREETEALRNAKPVEPSPGVVRAEVQADRVRRPYVGRLCGQVNADHRVGGT